MAKPANELTPMQRQYNEIKEANRDCILFFRLGDFYEMFNEDAKVAARELDLTTVWTPILQDLSRKGIRWPSVSR